MDPLFYGSTTSDTDIKLTSGKKVLDELESLVRINKPLDDVLNASKDVMDHFSSIFPEVVESNQVGELTKDNFSYWTPKTNEIKIELDPNPQSLSANEGLDVYIGGPAALTGATIQARSGQNPRKILYGHNGSRGVSNWKGSASYFHIRDAVPVYYWPDNHGAYTLYATAKHMYQRNFQKEKYMKEVCEDPSWNKLRLNFKSFFSEPSIGMLFAKNQLRAIKDVGLHLPGTVWSKPTDTTAYVTCEHAYLTHKIFGSLNAPKPLVMKSNDSTYALYTFLGEEKTVKETERVVNHIKDVAGRDLLDHKFLTEEEVTERGYNAKFVKKAAVFPNDGYFPPYIDGMMESMIKEEGGKVTDNMQLQKILVTPTKNGDTKVTKVEWRDSMSGEKHTTPVNSLYVSLGPSMKKMSVQSTNYSLLEHIKDTFSVKSGSKDSSDVSSVMNEPTLSSVAKQIVNKIRPSNMLNKMMWASGTSIVFMVKVDKSIVPESRMNRFRDHIDGHNKHIVRLAEKEVTIEDKVYQYFVLQTTGGGNFPIKDAHAETGLNIFKANVMPLLGLTDEGIQFDILQARSCARGITAQNVFRMSAPASNMVMIYGIGGIGMTTMAPNALLMKAVMGLRNKLAIGEISDVEFKQSLVSSNFSEIPHWNKQNPFSRNYAQFIDFVNHPKEIARRLGIKSSWQSDYLKNKSESKSKAFAPSQDDSMPVPQTALLQSKTKLSLTTTRLLKTLARYIR